MKNYEYEDEYSEDEDLSEDEGCSRCGEPLYSQPHWGYSQCEGCGARYPHHSEP